MDMNAFRNYLSNRANTQGEENKPTHNVFGKVLADLKQTNTQEAHYTSGKATGKGTTSPDLERVDLPGSNERARQAKMRRVRQEYGGPEPKKKDPTEEFSLTGRDILESFSVVDMFNDAVEENIEDGEDLVDAIHECLDLLDENDEDDRIIIESFAIVDNFYTTVMESVGLNEESEDLDSLVEEVLQQIDLDEVYGTKLPSVSQGLSDEEKRKVQKGETSKMPKSGVQDKIPGEKQSSVDAVTAVLGSKKNTVSDSSY